MNAKFIVTGNDILDNPSLNAVSNGGYDDAGQISVQNGSQPFTFEAYVEFLIEGADTNGELDGGSKFVGVTVYASKADYDAGIVQYIYVPRNSGQYGSIQSSVDGLGDTYVRFDASVFVSSDADAPLLSDLFLAPGTDLAKATGPVTIDHHVDVDLEGDGAIDGTSVEAENGKFNVGSPESLSDHGGIVACFTPGTWIKTMRGEILVERLRIGDQILTRDNGFQPVEWIGMRTLSARDLAQSPQFNPIKIRAGAIEKNVLERDMMVSPQHRMLMGGGLTIMWFGAEEVFASARSLTCLEGVDEVFPEEITYIHLLLSRHEIIMADGCWTESFQPGDHSLAGMDTKARGEILALFPELRDATHKSVYHSARMTLRQKEVPLLFA